MFENKNNNYHTPIKEELYEGVEFEYISPIIGFLEITPKDNEEFWIKKIFTKETINSIIYKWYLNYPHVLRIKNVL